MVTGYTFCIPTKNKMAEEIVTAWRNHIAFPFGVCRKLLMDNGIEFENDLFSRVSEQLGFERKIYSPTYRPQSNGRIEGFYKFLKSCLAKHILRHREWDDVVPLAAVPYNWLPNQHSKESPFFIMFGRDALTNLSQLTKPNLRYMGTEDLILDLELMSNFSDTNTQPENGQRMRNQRSTACQKARHCSWQPCIGKGSHSKCFMSKYKVDFHVVCIEGNKVKVIDLTSRKLT